MIIKYSEFPYSKHAVEIYWRNKTLDLAFKYNIFIGIHEISGYNYYECSWSIDNGETKYETLEEIERILKNKAFL